MVSHVVEKVERKDISFRFFVTVWGIVGKDASIRIVTSLDLAVQPEVTFVRKLFCHRDTYQIYRLAGVSVLSSHPAQPIQSHTIPAQTPHYPPHEHIGPGPKKAKTPSNFRYTGITLLSPLIASIDSTENLSRPMPISRRPSSINGTII